MITVPTDAPLPLVSAPVAAVAVAAAVAAAAAADTSVETQTINLELLPPPPPPSVESSENEDFSTVSLLPPRRFADRVARLRDNVYEWKIAGGNKKTKKTLGHRDGQCRWTQRCPSKNTQFLATIGHLSRCQIDQ